MTLTRGSRSAALEHRARHVGPRAAPALPDGTTAPTRARTMLWQKASATTVPSTVPSSGAGPPVVEQGAHGRRALATPAEGGEVVEPEQAARRPRPSPRRRAGRGPARCRAGAAGRRPRGRRRSGRGSGAAAPRSRASKPSGARPTRRTTRSAGGCRAAGWRRPPRRGGRTAARASHASGSTSTWATWPRACTPASVRPATTRRTGSSGAGAGWSAPRSGSPRRYGARAGRPTRRTPVPS